MVEVEDPGTKPVRVLMSDVASGDYVIPYFQRGFEWEPSMVSELFISILQDYYTGLLLFWELDNHRAEQEEWDPVWGATAAYRPNKAVLDGQQRLSSLYYAIHNPEKRFPNRKSYYVFYVDLIRVLNDDYDEAVDYTWKTENYQSWSELRSNRGKWIESGQVPLCILSAEDPDQPRRDYIDSEEFNKWATQFVEQRSEDLPDNTQMWEVREVFTNILNYNFVVYLLASERSMPDICNIFAKVNDTGMKLSTFDLMNAFLYPYDVQLRKELWEGLPNDQLKRIDSNMDENLLKIISLRRQNYCSSKYLYNLIPGEETVREEPDGTRYEEVLIESGEEFKDLWWSAVDYAEDARERIMNTGRTDFGAIRGEFIPYNPILPVLAAVLWQYNEGHSSVTENQFSDTLQRWYWSAVFSQDYSGSSDTAMGKDFRDWKTWFSGGGEIEQLRKVDEEFITEMDLATEDKGSGRYNAIICLLALNGVRDFYNERILGTGDFTEQAINDHHIFPKKVSDLPPERATNFDRFKDSILNRTLIVDETNQKIQNQKPSEYLAEMEEIHGDEETVRELMKGHFISDAAYDHLKNDDFDSFIMEREAEIKQQLIDRICS
ncbi:DUF262 domain-containing protein [Halorussus litoreus]|uniref:DUF262 domain-containing protein n=1 Tax=Halorussus litoreus TaxID=1710536 RepID=UPI000E24BA63|nr:DUF262 domain-containing protein [Halorussus litoreus]